MVTHKIKGVFFVLCCALLTSCGKGSGESTPLEDGVSGLEKLDSYLVVTEVSMERLNGEVDTLNYIEVNTPEYSYREYPRDALGNFGTLNYTPDADTDYFLSDWLTKDLFCIMVPVGDVNNVATYALPKSYGELCESRKTMYALDLEKGLTNIVEDGEEDLELGQGLVTTKKYKGTVTGECLSDVLAIDTFDAIGYYHSPVLYDMVKEETKSKDMENLCDRESKIGITKLTFGTGVVTYNLVDGVLRGLTVEAFGGGTSLTITKRVIGYAEKDLLSSPDFTKTDSYELLLNNIFKEGE